MLQDVRFCGVIHAAILQFARSDTTTDNGGHQAGIVDVRLQDLYPALPLSRPDLE
jgi:hypothetical protein